METVSNLGKMLNSTNSVDARFGRDILLEHPEFLTNDLIIELVHGKWWWGYDQIYLIRELHIHKVPHATLTIKTK